MLSAALHSFPPSSHLFISQNIYVPCGVSVCVLPLCPSADQAPSHEISLRSLGKREERPTIICIMIRPALSRCSRIKWIRKYLYSFGGFDFSNVDFEYMHLNAAARAVDLCKEHPWSDVNFGPRSEDEIHTNIDPDTVWRCHGGSL